MKGLWTQHAIEKAGLPAAWEAHRLECFPKMQDTLYVEVSGMVAPLKKNGCPNWRNGDRSTEKTVVITITEHDIWVAGWEIRTGKCSNCEGNGRELYQWDSKTGSEYRPCCKCNGT